MMNIYVADLQAYNNGILKGQWLELPMCEVELEEILSSYPSDYAIHDYEADFQISEYMDIQGLNEFAQMMEENKYNMEMLELVDNWQQMEVDELKWELEEIHTYYYSGDDSHYVPTKDLQEDFAYWHMVETGSLDESQISPIILNAINWEHVFHQLEMDFNFLISAENGKMYYKYRY